MSEFNLAEELHKKLRAIVDNEELYEDNDYDLCSACGGNIDDAWSIGCDDGEIALAKELLDEFFGES